jgi:hypothetical protein
MHHNAQGRHRSARGGGAYSLLLLGGLEALSAGLLLALSLLEESLRDHDMVAGGDGSIEAGSD